MVTIYNLVNLQKGLEEEAVNRDWGQTFLPIYFSHLSLTKPLWGGCYCPHFIIIRNWITSLKPSKAKCGKFYKKKWPSFLKNKWHIKRRRGRSCLRWKETGETYQANAVSESCLGPDVAKKPPINSIFETFGKTDHDVLCSKELLLILWGVVMLLQLCYKTEFLSVRDWLVKLYPVWICFKILQQEKKKKGGVKVGVGWGRNQRN